MRHYIGAHMSPSGGFAKMGREALKIGASTLAFFCRNPRGARAKVQDPADLAALCVKRGYWCRNHGSYLSIVPGIAEAYGLECESLNPEELEEDDLYLRLSAGDVAVALMTRGHFTRGGHFILLRGTTLGGELLVADPASRDRSLIPWDLSLILEELSPSRHNGAPLWALSSGAA